MAPLVLPALPVLPVVPLLLSVVGGVDGGGMVVVLPVVPEVLPDVLPEVPGELVLPVSVGSDLPQAPKASKELKAMASAGLKLKVFMGLPFEKIHFKNPTWRNGVGGARPVV